MQTFAVFWAFCTCSSLGFPPAAILTTVIVNFNWFINRISDFQTSINVHPNVTLQWDRFWKHRGIGVQVIVLIVIVVGHCLETNHEEICRYREKVLKNFPSMLAKLTKTLHLLFRTSPDVTNKLVLTNTSLQYMIHMSQKTHHVKKGNHGGSALNDRRVIDKLTGAVNNSITASSTNQTRHVTLPDFSKCRAL